MRETFRSINFTQDSRRIITTAVGILNTYGQQGYDLSLRQLYYQFIATDAFPATWIDAVYNSKQGLPANTKNTEKNYKRLGDIIANARDAGLIDWSMIRDRGRSVERVSTWDSPADIVDAVAKQFRYDLWADQPNSVLCMVEKQALEGVLEPVCNRLRIAFSANKGYASASHMYEIGKRLRADFLGDGDISDYDFDDAYGTARNYSSDFDQPDYFDCGDEGTDIEGFLPDISKMEEAINNDKGDYSEYNRLLETATRQYMKPHPNGGKAVHVIYLGDHDPSGIDMTRDVKDRLETYSRVPVQVHRVALNMPQVRQFNPPPNPAKITDSRAEGYIRQFGTESWELDALTPSVLANLVESLVLGLRDDDTWAQSLEREDAGKRLLATTAAEYRKSEVDALAAELEDDDAV